MNITRALVVDDSKTARISLKKQLEKRGIEVDVAETGEEALSYLRSCAPLYPNIIYMDIMMPGIDGLEATKSISTTPETSTIPVIMCTSKDDEQTKIAAQENGAIGFAVKPIKGDELDRSLQIADKQIAELSQALESVDIEREKAPEPAPVQATVDTAAVQAQVTKLAQGFAAKVAEDVATRVAQHAAQSAAQAIAEQMVQNAKSTAEKMAQASAAEVAKRISEQVATERTRVIIEQITQQLVQNTAREEVEKIRSSMNTELKNSLGAFLRSPQAAVDIQRVIEDKCVNTATNITKQAIKDSESRAQDIATFAAKKAVLGVKILSYLLALSVLCMGGYLTAVALKLL